MAITDDNQKTMAELRSLDPEGLKVLMHACCEKLQHMQMLHRLKKLQKTHLLRLSRRYLAQIHTVYRQKQLERRI